MASPLAVPGPGPGDRALLLARGTAVLSVAMLAGGLLGAAARPPTLPAEYRDWAMAVSCVLIGIRMIGHVRRNAVGWIVLGAGASAALTVCAAGWDSVPGLVWIRDWSWCPQWALMPVATLLFPGGSDGWRGWRIFALCAAGCAVVATAALAVASAADPWGFFREQAPDGQAPGTAMYAFMVAVLGLVLAALAAVVRLALRAWRADGTDRRISAWMLGAVVLLVAADVLDSYAAPGVWVAAALAMPAALVVAITRYGLYDIGLLMHRSLLYGSLTAALLALYTAAVAVGTATMPEHAAAFAAATLVLLVRPLHTTAQRLVERALYGRRSEPYAVMSELGERLEGRGDPATILAVVARTIGESLNVPYVAVHWPGETAAAAEYGRPTTRILARRPLTFRGERVGELVVGARSPEEGPTAPELRTLTEIARQAGAAAYAVRLTLDLQQARERLVAAREEERLRLRRDLHDGVGPALAGLTMQVGTARAELRTDPNPDRLARFLGVLERELVTCTADVRRVVRGLRPPVLDESGLAAAIQERAGAFTRGGCPTSISVTAEDRQLAGLPPAVEVAALRIAVEGMTNVVRHARAATCEVTLRRQSDSLEITVDDDGIGIDLAGPPGVGRKAMQERAAELGGVCTVTERPTGGTTVRARLPIAAGSRA